MTGSEILETALGATKPPASSRTYQNNGSLETLRLPSPILPFCRSAVLLFCRRIGSDRAPDTRGLPVGILALSIHIIVVAIVISGMTPNGFARLRALRLIDIHCMQIIVAGG